MKRVFAYLLIVLTIYSLIGILFVYEKLSLPSQNITLALYCGIFGGVGGVTYCLRGIYLNACVRNQWSEVWIPWYIIRPIVSFLCGVVSYLFLKAGLIILESHQTESPTNFALYALAFVAGLNVDKFIERIEDIAQITWGIKRSRTGKKDDENA